MTRNGTLSYLALVASVRRWVRKKSVRGKSRPPHRSAGYTGFSLFRRRITVRETSVQTCGTIESVVRSDGVPRACTGNVRHAQSRILRSVARATDERVGRAAGVIQIRRRRDVQVRSTRISVREPGALVATTDGTRCADGGSIARGVLRVARKFRSCMCRRYSAHECRGRRREHRAYDDDSRKPIFREAPWQLVRRPQSAARRSPRSVARSPRSAARRPRSVSSSRHSRRTRGRKQMGPARCRPYAFSGAAMLLRNPAGRTVMLLRPAASLWPPPPA